MKDKTNADKLSKLSSKSSSALPNKDAPNLFVTKSFDKNLSTLQLYNNVFGVQTYFNHIGDANTHFKKTLRRYNEFNGIKNTKWLENKYKKLKPKFNKREYKEAAGDAIRVVHPKPNVTTSKLETEAATETEAEAEATEEPPQQPPQLTQFDQSETLDNPERSPDEDDPPDSPLPLPLFESLSKKQIQDKFFEDLLDRPQEELQRKLQEHLQKHIDEFERPQDEETKEIMADQPDGSGSPTEEVRTPEELDQQFVKSIEQMQKVLEKPKAAAGDSMTAIYPQVDRNVMAELEDAECQARQTANVINDLKQRVTDLLCKNHMTDNEAEELEEMNRLLTDHMSKFEEKTKLIQMLVNTADQHIRMLPDQKKHKEDMLPKVVICGMTENNMPKILICESKKQGKNRSASSDRGRRVEGGGGRNPPCAGVVPQIAKRLSESYDMQEKLAADNIDLEGKRYELQEQLMSQDKTVEGLQRQLCTMQQELRAVCKENSMLTEKLERIQGKCKTHPELPCGSLKGVCPADVENRLQHYQNATSTLERQVELMEDEVKRMQDELVAVRRERAEIEYRRLAKEMQASQGNCKPTCAGPCRGSTSGGPSGSGCACPPTPSSGSGGGGGATSTGGGVLSAGASAPAPPICPSPLPTSGTPCMADQQLRELREQYNRLQDDYKSKLVEVAGLRADNEQMKRTSRDNDRLKRELDCKLEEMEREIKQHRAEKAKMMGSKEMMIEQEQQLAVAKQRFREAQDELDELRACIQDQATQLDDYRNKYLTAQQQVEEQRRQIDVMEMENARIGEQVTCEIQRVKAQFQERLAELAPLPDILKATQLKLQEEQHCRGIAERNSDALARELQMYKDKLACLASQMEKQRNDQQLGEDERVSLMSKISGWECKCSEVQSQCDRLKTEVARCEEQQLQSEKRLDEKLHEVAQLTAQLDNVREESARQVTRTKERCETVRRSLQAQVAELERQLAQSRAAARAAQKDRDEIRHKMQAQITNLNDNFEEAQLRIRSLQGHVNFLKTSYTTMFGGDSPCAPPPCVQPVADDDSNASCNCTSTYT